MSGWAPFLSCSGSILLTHCFGSSRLLLGSNYGSLKIHVATSLHKGRWSSSCSVELTCWSNSCHDASSIKKKKFMSPLQTDSRATGSPWISAVPMAMVPIAQVATWSPFTSDLCGLSPVGDCQEVNFFFWSVHQQTHVCILLSVNTSLKGKLRDSFS